MCFREGSKMDIEELYRCVFNNVSKNQYDKAFEIALSAYQSYTLNELDEFRSEEHTSELQSRE